MKNLPLYVVSFFIFYNPLHADQITVRNLTDEPLAAAIYKVKGKSSDGVADTITRASDVVTIAVRGMQKLERPAKSFCGLSLCDRDIYISPDPAALTEQIQKNSIAWVNVGDTEGADFLVSSLGGKLQAFSAKKMDLISVANETEKDIFVAIYYLPGTSNDQKGGDALRFNEPIKIAPKNSIQIARPPQRCTLYTGGVCTQFQDRDLYVASAASELSQSVPKGSLPFVNIGASRGNSFYIAQETQGLVGYNKVTWAARPATKLLGDIGDVILQSLRKQFEEHDYAHLTAIVRNGADLCIEEKRYLLKRLPRAKQALETLLDMQLANNELPRIAFCGSGGGYRAMVSTLGFLQGAQEIGLFDAAVYNVGLSGSTWAIAGALQSEASFEEYIKQLSQKLMSDLISHVSPSAATQIAQTIAKRLCFDQTISIIDLYGGLLAEKLLKQYAATPQDITLASQVNLVDSGTAPLPLYTALVDVAESYEWIEYTPYEVGSASSQAFIPSWSLGRSFSAGSSQDFAPSLSLGFCMGTWGSAMSVHAQDALQSFKSDVPPTFELLNTKIPSGIVTSALETAFKRVPQVTSQRIYPAKVANWMYNMPQSRFKNIAQLTLIDAGIDFNLPTPPLLRPERNISIIIILDSSGKTQDAPELRKAENYARKNNLKFPKIDYAHINTLCSVFTDEDPTVPTIIYLPLMANAAYQNNWDPRAQAFTSTFNFAYMPDNVLMLSGLTAANMVTSKEMIIDAIRHSVEKKRTRNVGIK